MSSPLPDFYSFFRCLAGYAGRRLWLSLGLMIGLGVLEGGGLLLLVPLLQAVGMNATANSPGFGKWTLHILKAGHIPLTLVAVLTVFIAIMSAQAGLRVYLSGLNTRIETSFICFLRGRLYEAMMGSDWLFFTRQRSSDITQALMEELQRVSVGTGQLLALLSAAGVAAVQIAIAFSLSPPLTCLAIASGAIIIFFLRPLTGRSHRLGRIPQQKRAEMASAVNEHLSGMKVAKSHGREHFHLIRFLRVMNEIADHLVRGARLNAATRACLEIGSMLALSAFLYSAVAIEHMKIGEVMLLAFIFTRLLSRLMTIQSTWQLTIQTLPSFTSTEAMREKFLTAAEPLEQRSTERIQVKREIRLENVGFSYDPPRGHAALCGVNLSIPVQQVTAICGPSGAGKSTLADLLLGLLRPSEGRILIDGEPLTGARLRAWRESVGYVPQETFLFHETIRSNLLWARPEASPSEIDAALRTAAAEEFVKRLPQGLDTVIGDRGVRLSGGERQRLALARALLRQPAVLVLDEATSALDTHNERLIKQAIEKLHGCLTIVIIAHRLSTVRMADRIVVLEKGRMVEAGRWEELCEREGGVFRELLAAGLST